MTECGLIVPISLLGGVRNVMEEESAMSSVSRLCDAAQRLKAGADYLGNNELLRAAVVLAHWQHAETDIGPAPGYLA